MKKLSGIDIFKFIMSIIVIAVHTKPFYNCNNIIVNKLFNTVKELAVPFFFMSSGFLLAVKINKNKDDKIKCVKKYFIKMVKLYVIWTIAYLPLTLIGYCKNGQSLKKCLLLFLRGFLLMGENYNSYMLWYLLSSIYATILIIVLLKKNISNKQIRYILIIIFVISCCLDANEIYKFNIKIIDFIIAKTIVNGRIFRGMYYIPLGISMFYKNIEKKKGYVLFILGIIFEFLFWNNIFIRNISIVTTSIGLFTIVINLNIGESKKYYLIRKNSTYMYFIHMYVWTAYYMIVYGYKKYGIGSFTFTTIFSILLSTIYIYVKDKFFKIEFRKKEME